jgi:integrase
MRLDAKTIADLTLPQGKSEQFFWDDELKGFGYRLRRGSRPDVLHRTWVAQYRASGRTRRSTWPAERLMPAQAREAARQVLAQVTLGGDPQGRKKADRVRAARSFRSVVDAYLEAKLVELRPASISIANLYLRRGPYFRALHSIGITEITHADIAARLSSIVRNHSTTTAGAARRAISALYAWAIQEGWATANPVINTRKPPDPEARDRVLTNSELVTIWNACSDDDDAGRIIRLLILLASRKSEVGGMRWSELDLDTSTWTLPKERSKNRRSHTVTLPPAALDIIRSVPRRSRDHLFGDRSLRGFTEWHRAKIKLDRKLAGVVKPWRLHDLRRSVATKMADDVGIEPHHVEAVLNHFSGRGGVAGVYNRARYEIAIASALRRWSEHVLAMVEGRESNIVSMQRA